ncbi:MAG: hypothetical protein E7Z71_00105 [Methanocorpusculum parvum]|nr:hypothetical protein [Methanocorpusculum parvum]
MKTYHIVIVLLLACLCIAPASAADADPIVGEWGGIGSMPFLFFTIDCASAIAEIYEDGTGTVTGSARILFLDILSVQNEPLTWKKTGENRYAITACGVTVPVTYNPDMDMLTGSVSTAELGAEFDLTISGMAVRHV